MFIFSCLLDDRERHVAPLLAKFHNMDRDQNGQLDSADIEFMQAAMKMRYRTKMHNVGRSAAGTRSKWQHARRSVTFGVALARP